MSSCRTNHGFDEFFGNLYHLNAEEEPEASLLAWQQSRIRRRATTRAAFIHSFADGKIERHRPTERQADADH